MENQDRQHIPAILHNLNYRRPFYIQAFFPALRKIFPSIGWWNKRSSTQPTKGNEGSNLWFFFFSPSSQNRKLVWQFCHQKLSSLILDLRAQLSRDSPDTHRHDRSPLLRGCGKSGLLSLDAAKYMELYAHWHAASARLSIRCLWHACIIHGEPVLGLRLCTAPLLTQTPNRGGQKIMLIRAAPRMEK